MTKTKMLTSEMAAEILGISASWIRRLIQNGRLTGTKYGHDWILTTLEVNRYKLKQDAKKTTKESIKCKLSSQASESSKKS